MFAPGPVVELVRAAGGVVETLARVGEVANLSAGRPANAWPMAFEGHEIVLVGAMDQVNLDVERQRLEQQGQRLRDRARRLQELLMNEEFLSRAKAEVVEQNRRNLVGVDAELDALERRLAMLR